VADWSLKPTQIVRVFSYCLCIYRVTTCLENLEVLGNLTAVTEISEILLKVREVSWKISCQWKVA